MLVRLSLFFLLLIAPLGFAGGNTNDLDELRERLAPLESLSARFRQTVTGADGYVLQTLTGELTVARPGKVYWQSDDPYPQQVISDGQKLWLYDPDLAQVTVRPFQRDISQTPAILFIGEVSGLDNSYKVVKESMDARLIYWLTPTGNQSLYQKLAIEFAGEQPVAMSLWDSLGQQTRIELSDTRINKALNTEQFEFTIPEGVDVLYDD